MNGEVTGEYGERLAAAIGPGAGLLSVWDRIPSTSALARELAADGGADRGAALVAEEQTAGRGSEGRVWVSPLGGVYLSILFRMDKAPDPKRMGLVPIAAGVAAAEAIEEAAGIRVAVRWPNDLDGARGKLGGILVEAGFASRQPRLAVAGIGINIGPPPPVPGAPTPPDGLPPETKRETVVAALLAAFERVRSLSPAEIASRWESRSPTGRGCPCLLRLRDGADVVGETAGIEANGALRVRIGKETRIVHASDAVAIRHHRGAG